MFGEVNSFSFSVLASSIAYLFANPWIWLGVSTLIFALLLYLTAISRLDLSYVLPIRAFGYVLNALLAWLLLGEHISPVRWLATTIIAVGVFIITWNESKELEINTQLENNPSTITLGESDRGNPWQEKKPINLSMLLFAGNFYLSKIWLGLLVLVLADSSGDLLIVRGMKQVGRVTLLPLPKMLQLGQRILSNLSVLSGIACYAISFSIFLYLLSWADLSFVRPATAMGYLFSLLGARYILEERVTRGRLVGIVVIGLGVGIISFT